MGIRSLHTLTSHSPPWPCSTPTIGCCPCQTSTSSSWTTSPTTARTLSAGKIPSGTTSALTTALSRSPGGQTGPEREPTGPYTRRPSRCSRTGPSCADENVSSSRTAIENLSMKNWASWPTSLEYFPTTTNPHHHLWYNLRYLNLYPRLRPCITGIFPGRLFPGRHYRQLRHQCHILTSKLLPLLPLLPNRWPWPVTTADLCLNILSHLRPKLPHRG